MLNKLARILIIKHAKITHRNLAIFLAFIGVAASCEAIALPKGQDAVDQIDICCAKQFAAQGVERFTLGDDAVSNGFGDFIKFPALVATECEPVPKQKAAQKTNGSHAAREGDGDLLHIHLVYLICAIAFVFGVAFGLGPPRDD